MTATFSREGSKLYVNSDSECLVKLEWWSGGSVFPRTSAEAVFGLSANGNSSTYPMLAVRAYFAMVSDLRRP